MIEWDDVDANLQNWVKFEKKKKRRGSYCGHPKTVRLIWVLFNPSNANSATTNQLTANHLPTDAPTTNPLIDPLTNNNRPMDKILFKRLYYRKNSFYRTQTHLGKCKTILQSIFEHLQKKTALGVLFIKHLQRS